MPLAALVLLIAAWECVIIVGHMSPLVLPSPLAIASAGTTHARELTREVAFTMAEALAGFLLGSATAYALAILFVHSRVAEQAIMPYAVALKSTPLIALAPILVIWYGDGFLGKMVMSALVSFWPVLVAGLRGLRAVTPESIALMDSLGATRWQKLWHLRVPGSFGYLFAALKVSSSLAVVGAVIGELVGSNRGIGRIINQSSYYLQTAVVFAAVAYISMAAIAFYGVIALLERRFAFWNESSISKEA